MLALVVEVEVEVEIELVVLAEVTLFIELDEDVELVAFVIARVPNPIAKLVTGPVLPPSAFWYHGMPNASGTDFTIHPFSVITGYSVMKTPTVLLLSSCSSMHKPGDFGPLNQPSIVASTPEIV